MITKIRNEEQYQQALKMIETFIEVGAPKLSQILKGKRAPDVPFLKAVHKKPGIDGIL